MNAVEYDKSGRMKYNPDYHGKHKTDWHTDDYFYLIDWYDKISIEEMSLALERTEATITGTLQYLKKTGVISTEKKNKYIRADSTNVRSNARV